MLTATEDMPPSLRQDFNLHLLELFFPSLQSFFALRLFLSFPGLQLGIVPFAGRDLTFWILPETGKGGGPPTQKLIGQRYRMRTQNNRVA